MVYKLATPANGTDFSWIKPGKSGLGLVERLESLQRGFPRRYQQ